MYEKMFYFFKKFMFLWKNGGSEKKEARLLEKKQVSPIQHHPSETEAYSEPFYISKMEPFVKAGNGFQPLTISRNAPSQMTGRLLDTPLRYDTQKKKH